MTIEEDLRKIGLNKYESKAYLTIIKHTVIDAKIISKESEIPHGKIYETLSSLENKGFIEAQNTRPKKYRAIKPAKSFEIFFSKKKENVEEELNKTKELLDSIGEKLSNKNKIVDEESNFWKVAFKENIPKMIIECFDNVDYSVHILMGGHEKNPPEIKNVNEELRIMFKKINYIVTKGIDVKIIKNVQDKLSAELMNEFGFETDFSKFVREIKLNTSDIFMIFDEEIVLLEINNPLNKNEMLAMIKVWNPSLAKQLSDKFKYLWKTSHKMNKN